jgi:hypothetical protein
MAEAGIYFNRIAVDGKDDAILLVYAYTPFSGKIFLKWFRLADAVVSIAIYALQKRPDALCHPRVAL